MSWLRDKMKAIIWFTVIAFVVTIFAGWGMQYLGWGMQSRYLAEINGERISWEQYSQHLDRQREQYRRSRNAPLTSQEQNRLRRQAFTQLVNQTLLHQQFAREGGITTQDEIRRNFAIQNRMVTSQGQIDRARVQRALQQMPEQQREEFERRIRGQIESFRVRSWIQSQVTLTETEHRRLLRAGLREARTYGVFVDPKQFVAEEKIRAYYQSKEREFAAAPRAKIRQILLQAADTAAGREQRLQSITRRANVIQRRFDAGDSFAELAREYSADTQTAPQGGMRGWVTQENAPEKIVRAAFGLSPGEMSRLVPTQQGYYLIYLEKGPIREKKPLDRVRERIRARLLADTHWQQARNVTEKYYRRAQRSENPKQTLRELAFLHSDGQTAPQEGDYGWVPARFVVPSLHKNADRWSGEITEGRIIDPAVSRSLFEGHEKELREPVRSDFGLHTFYVEDFREPRLSDLSDTDSRRIRDFLVREKQASYLEQWLAFQRRQADVSLEVPVHRIGGEIPWLKERTS